MWISLQRVTSLRRRAHANAPVTSYWLHRVRRRRAPRSDESIVQGVSGAEPAKHRCLVRFLNFLTCDSGTQSNISQEDVVRLLSKCTSKLQQLSVTNTPLTALPEAVCRMSNIQKLNLDGNRLAALPSNCFTLMHNLTSFSANRNRLTSLQVRWYL